MTATDPSVRRLARAFARLQSRVGTLESAPQLGYSSFEGFIREYLADGETPASQIGQQWDGTHGVVAFTGPTPPAPTTPIVEARAGGLMIRWDGDFEGDAVAPMDFSRVEVHVSTQDGFLPVRTTLLTTFASPQGEEVFLSLPAALHHVRMLTRSTAGKPSDTTVQVSATPAPLVDTALIDEALAGFSGMKISEEGPTEADVGDYPGQLWWQIRPGGDVIGQWAWAPDLGGWADRRIDGRVLAADSVAASKILAESITARELAAGSVEAGKIAANAVTATTIAAGAITADKLSAFIILATDIFAGDPAGAHLALRPDGIHVYADDPQGGEPQEVIRLGTSGSDYFGVADAAGRLVSSISQQGVASFVGLTTELDVTVAGRRLLGDGLPSFMATTQSPSWFDLLPRGLVPGGWGQITAYSTATDNSPGVGVFEIDVTLQGGRDYKVHTSALRLISDDEDTLAECRVVFKRTEAALGATPPLPAAPVVSDPVLARDIRAVTDPTGEGLHVVGKFSPPGGPGVASRYRLLLTVLRPQGSGRRPTGGWVQIAASAVDPAQLWVEDIGPAVPNAGQVNTGGGIGITPTVQVPTPPATPPAPTTPPRRNYTDDFPATWIRSYRGNGQPYQDGQAYQGNGGSSFVGTARSMIGFPDLIGPLSGSLIYSMEIYLNFTHWWNNSGGTAVIGLHPYSGIQPVYASNVEQIVISGGWPKPGARWVPLPVSVWDGFRDGTYRGITLRAPGDSTAKEYYGIANDARIRVNYSK